MVFCTKNQIKVFLSVVIIFVYFCFCGFGVSWAAYDYIDITNPFLRKIPIAVPEFATLSDSKKEKEISNTGTQILSQTLAFTGYFNLIDRKAFLDDLNKTGIEASRVKFPNWTGIGAELLISGGVKIEGDKAFLELRLFDTFKEKLLVGKRYKCELKDQQNEILRFCSLVIHELTGKWGIFDSKIAFISTTTGNKEIYICDFDGRNPKKFTNTKNITLSPAWSSDRKWIAYTSYEKGKPDLYIKNIYKNQTFVVDKEGINITPAWIPGEFSLAATLSFSGDQEIYMLTGAGKIIKRLTRKWGIDVSPTFSPDGKKMAFVSKRAGTPQIYIKYLESGRAERLTYKGNYNTTPNWSPSGNKIAYSAMENGRFNIYVIDTDGGNLIQLTNNSGDNESPAWSPDGSLIAFCSTREGLKKIYVMTAFGTDQRRLINMRGEQSNPAWSPNIINN